MFLIESDVELAVKASWCQLLFRSLPFRCLNGIVQTDPNVMRFRNSRAGLSMMACFFCVR
jgi:hypothetical protein